MQTPQPSEREIENRNIFEREFIADKELLGVWERKDILIDWGEEIKRIYFMEKGKLSFSTVSPTLGRTTFYADYRLFSDTMKVYFENKYYVESYLYHFKNGFLQVKSLNTNRYETYYLTEYKGDFDFYKRFQ